ncbi:MAG: DUF296 domain-containing protein [Candidatus Thermoplasmatota archaeon]|nr:DUF296 domain-containing protein [Candidatus Thermoplasmatota archaeon]
MQVKEQGDIIVAKFTEGKAIENLEGLARRYDVHSAVILSGIGMLDGAAIGYYDGSEYVTQTLDEPAELVSMNGNIGRRRDSGDVVCHIHVALAGSDHRLVGGHLMDGMVMVVNEIVLRRLDPVVIHRAENEQGLLEMQLE